MPEYTDMPLMRVPQAQTEETVITAPFLEDFQARILGSTNLVMIGMGKVLTYIQERKEG